MKERRKTQQDGIEYGIHKPSEDIVCVYESSHADLRDERFHAFPDCLITNNWDDAWAQAEKLLGATKKLYYGVKVHELTVVYGISESREALETSGFDVESDWHGFMCHHAHKLLRLKMRELGITEKIID